MKLLTAGECKHLNQVETKKGWICVDCKLLVKSYKLIDAEDVKKFRDILNDDGMDAIIYSFREMRIPDFSKIVKKKKQ